MYKQLLVSLPLCTLAILSGCSSPSVSYGEPTAPTASQMQAVTRLTSVGANVSAAVKGMSTADKPFDIQGVMASLQGSAIHNGGSQQSLTLEPSGLDPACTSGSAETGYTYTNCMNDGGKINGSVQITPTSVTYDLSIGASSNTTITLKGPITYTAGRITGNLDYKIHLDLGSYAGIAGTNTDVTTDAIWDIAYTEEPSCITAGSIEVKVNYANMLQGAKFLFAGCASVMVQNG